MKLADALAEINRKRLVWYREIIDLSAETLPAIENAFVQFYLWQGEEIFAKLMESPALLIWYGQDINGVSGYVHCSFLNLKFEIQAMKIHSRDEYFAHEQNPEFSFQSWLAEKALFSLPAWQRMPPFTQVAGGSCTGNGDNG